MIRLVRVTNWLLITVKFAGIRCLISRWGATVRWKTTTLVEISNLAINLNTTSPLFSWLFKAPSNRADLDHLGFCLPSEISSRWDGSAVFSTDDLQLSYRKFKKSFSVSVHTRLNSIGKDNVDPSRRLTRLLLSRRIHNQSRVITGSPHFPTTLYHPPSLGPQATHVSRLFPRSQRPSSS